MSDLSPDLSCPRFLLGVPVCDIPSPDTAAWMLEQMSGSSPGFAMSLPATWLAHAWKHAAFQEVLREARLVLPDSKWVLGISGYFGPRIMHGHAPVDVALQAAAAEQAGVRVYLLAPEAGIASAAGTELQKRYPRLAIAGTGGLPRPAAAAADQAALLASIAAAKPGLVLADLKNAGHAVWLRESVAHWSVPLALGLDGGLAELQPRHWYDRYLPTVAMARAVTSLMRNERFALAAAGALLLLRKARQARRDAGEEPVAPPEPNTLTGLPATLAVFQRLPDEQTAQDCLSELGAQARLGALILDMHACPWLDSRELGVLVALANQCRRRQARLFLCNTSAAVARLVEASRLETELTIPASSDVMLTDLRRRRETDALGVASAQGDTVLVTLPAELTVASLEFFRARVSAVWSDQLRAGTLRQLHVDASRLTFMDSAAMGYLLYLRKITVAAGVTIQFDGFHGVAKQSLKLARLEQLFKEGSE